MVERLTFTIFLSIVISRHNDHSNGAVIMSRNNNRQKRLSRNNNRQKRRKSESFDHLRVRAVTIIMERRE